MKRLFHKIIGLLMLGVVLAPVSVLAEELIMARINQGFPETMSSLQAAIAAQGYKVSRVQRVDIGLTKSGFQTDKYRVVFFGKAEEYEALIKKQPDLIPYLPLKISIFAEENDTILVSTNPQVLAPFYTDISADVFQKWSDDVHEIFKQVKASE